MGFLTCVSLKSARNEPAVWVRAERARRPRPSMMADLMLVVVVHEVGELRRCC